MNPQAINAVAYLMHEIRPEWDVPGCVAALRKLDVPLVELGIAAFRYAQDPANLTPANLSNFTNRAWDSAWYLPCKTHPDCRARRTDGTCGACFADGHAVAYETPQRPGVAPSDEARATMLAAIGRGNG